MLNNSDAYFFHQGTHYRAYKYLGCSALEHDGSYSYTFRVWAPGASSVGLISDFSGWGDALPLDRITDNGVWETTLTYDHSLDGKAYKYRIIRGDRVFDKGDPYAVFSRGFDDGGSVIYTSHFDFTDGEWLEYRRRTFCDAEHAYPMNIYEMHLGSFMRHSDNSYYTYREYADILPPYLKRMGYTHVEFLPLAEYPYDASWGYQPCAFFAPSMRFGDPDGLRLLVNSLHRSGLGVILDWVGAHFPKDAWGLYELDGAPLYEYQGRDRMESDTWGTRFFDLGREEVQSFLVSNVLYYLEEFHFDGIRVDAVASMLYLDYDRRPGEWIPGVDGTNINPEAVAFFKKLNSVVKEYHPDVLMIAEESGSYGAITKEVSKGGLGFDLKWNMGFANDFYDYLSWDPVFRRHKHTALTFPIMYAFNERYCLPVSHDEVVHGKRSFADKPYGDFNGKLEQARAALMMIMTFPGKKLTFMGTEYAQMREWDFSSSLEWFMLDYEAHRRFAEYVAELNSFYLRTPALWEIDHESCGFKWLLPEERDKNAVAYRRISRDGSAVDVIINFSGSDIELCVPVGCAGVYRRIFDTGNLFTQNCEIPIIATESEYSARVYLPKFAGIIMTVDNGRSKFKL